MIDLRSNFRIKLGFALALVAIVIAVACEAPKSEPVDAGAVDETHRIFVVHSYSTAFPWTADLHEGIINGLSESGLNPDRDYQLQTFYMDTRINFTTPEQIQERAAEALEALQDFVPDILFVTDDIALEHVAVRYAEQNPSDPLPTVFTGVNVDPTVYAPISSLDVPGGSITGALERIPYEEAFATAQRLFPDATRVVIIGDAGSATQSARAAFMLGGQSADYGPIEVVDFLLFEEFEQWKSAVAEFQDKADFIAILNFHQLRDAGGAIVAPSEVVDWMVANNDLPEIGLLADWARDGILVAVGNSGLKTGAYVGALGADILDGADPATTPIVDPKQTDVNFNLARARSLGIEFAADEVDAADMAFEAIGGR
ncbi:MAG: ABC transporter substrate binding protein [Chloroflexota bacterium]|nr:ABC transporter substrate binding protein [Chloroflexota bacterium]